MNGGGPAYSACRVRPSALHDRNCSTIEGCAYPQGAGTFSRESPQAIIFFGRPLL
jgi:hypothetical protein